MAMTYTVEKLQGGDSVTQRQCAGRDEGDTCDKPPVWRVTQDAHDGPMILLFCDEHLDEYQFSSASLGFLQVDAGGR